MTSVTKPAFVGVTTRWLLSEWKIHFSTCNLRLAMFADTQKKARACSVALLQIKFRYYIIDEILLSNISVWAFHEWNIFDNSDWS